MFILKTLLIMTFIFTGGRVLITVNIAPTLALTAARATQAAQYISFDGKQFRTDIAHKGIARCNTLFINLFYKILLELPYKIL